MKTQATVCYTTQSDCKQINNDKSCAQCGKFTMNLNIGERFKFPDLISKVSVSSGASRHLVEMIQKAC